MAVAINPTHNRLTKQAQFNGRLKSYAEACRLAGAGRVNPGYVEEQLRELKQSLQDVVAAAIQEGKEEPMNRAARYAAQSLINELDTKLSEIPCSPTEHAEIRAVVALGIFTGDQKRAIEFALTDQARAIDRDKESYYENVRDASGTEIGRNQVMEEILRTQAAR